MGESKEMWSGYLPNIDSYIIVDASEAEVSSSVTFEVSIFTRDKEYELYTTHIEVDTEYAEDFIRQGQFVRVLENTYPATELEKKRGQSDVTTH